MKKIKKIIISIMSFFHSKRVTRYFITIAFCILFLALFGLFTSDAFANLLSIFFGFLISHLTLSIFSVISARLEDASKVSEDEEKLFSIYNDVKNIKTVEINGTKTRLLYKVSMVNKGYNIIVDDNKNKIFEPDGFCMDNFNTLFKAHQYSNKKNMLTVRMDSCKKTGENEYTLSLSRSTYFNHLITNRAADYELDSGITLREYYEYGPDLTNMEDSKMSNHIGVIALVYLKDGELLLPRRQGNSTISKNKITSSIATMLKLPKSGEISKEFLLRGCVFDELVGRTKLKEEMIDPNQTDIEFLGCGQDFYEVGKPHLFFKVTLKNITKQQYIECLSQREKENKNAMDQDKCIYIVNKDSLKFVKDKVQFDYFKGKIDKKGNYFEKIKNVTLKYEHAFACNIWHEQEVNK